MALDRVRVLKIEKPATGGTQTDVYPTDINPNEDAVDARGIALQNDVSIDETVLISRDIFNNMTFADGVVSGVKTLTELLAGADPGITADAHETLRQLIHFIEDGPAEGFDSGAYREITGTMFPSSVVWYTDSGKTDKIVEKLITWTGVNATSIQWKMYSTDGSTVLTTVTDAVTYSGIFETSRTRTIVVS